MISHTEAQEMHELIGSAVTQLDFAQPAEIEQWLTRAREIAAVVVSDTDDDTPLSMVRFTVSSSQGRLGSFCVPEPAVDSYDPVLVTFEHGDGRSVVGVDFIDSEHANVGHWPEGEEWVEIATVHPVESTA